MAKLNIGITPKSSQVHLYLAYYRVEMPTLELISNRSSRRPR
jgi:hypothetical protein